MITKLPHVTSHMTLHNEAKIDTIKEYIQCAALNFYEKCQDHSNPLVAGLGDYEHRHDRHKRPRSVVPNI